MSEPTEQFESRKRDHIVQALAGRNQASGLTGFEQVRLIHEALPEVNFSDIKIDAASLGESRKTPFLVSSMTAGHVDAIDLNLRLAKACEKRGWLFAVGSQRRELNDSAAADEWRQIRAAHPDLSILGNIGISQIAKISTSDVERLVESLGASAMIVHCNPLQEVIQEEGTPNFEGSFEALNRLCEELSVPVVVKETGCGFSEPTLYRLKRLKIAAIDVAGLGGTHWGRIEGSRSGEESFAYQLSETFKDWGVSTVESLLNAKSTAMDSEVWASGGVRSGLDAAKAIAMGAKVVGMATPILRAALESEQALELCMQRIETELKIAVFCTGLKSVAELHNNDEVLQWENH
ncbi:MAG: type 2 isopentenyl-diphosphate Delta-isomerase [Bdellovibrionales bacterium]|nr:type 2 isopentenyl-diphosphate Delta-isomerase [Bdellovibrionales bacterium]